MDNPSQGLDQLAVNLGNLTRNLETLNTIAAGFKEPSNLWHDFHTAIKPETEKEGRIDTRK
ncbi:hypothetical protein BJV82DRAFT_670592 [Fennellomyces sp. T-0311]|nr:hypothetical protein BJV82DRAFT_670592 [Fennellomyces sp. T-0311]